MCLGINDEWINDCKYDAAGHLLEHIYGSLNAPGGTSAGSILEFDQREFAPKNDANSIGLADKGFVYVPMDCLSQTCRVHVVFHGCLQYAGNPKVGRAVVERGGYNRWAETNRFIVLYPQTNDDQRGCWDWLGFKNTNDFARKAGGQISAIRAMLDRLAENFVPGAGSSDTFGTPQHFRVADKTSTSVALTWQPNSAATGFNIYRSGSSGGPYTIINAVPITGAAFADRGLTASTTYHYEIRAIDGAGQESAPTNPAVVGVTGMAPSPCEPYFSNNSMHAARVRALPLPDIFGNARAVGSLDNMGPLTDHDFSQLIKEDRPFPFYHVRYCP